jgi:trigger factor
MRATAEPQEGNRVRLSVEIDEAEMDEALDQVIGRLAREVRVPGFRPGKVPRRVIEARMGGAAALRGEAIREALPDFYAQAVSDTEVDPIDQPEIDITSGDEAGAVSFDAVVMVRPTVAIPGYQGLVVTLPDLEVTDEEVDSQIDRLRATSGELVEVGRPARDGDQVTADSRVRGTTMISTPRISSTRWEAGEWSQSSTTSCGGANPVTSSASTRRSGRPTRPFRSGCW